MKVLDPGHLFQLDSLDGDFYQELRFVKREGEKFPGNVGSYSGTTMQEVLRALMSRLLYLENQKPHQLNKHVYRHLMEAIFLLEERAAMQHNRHKDFIENSDISDIISGEGKCQKCGYLGCKGHE